MKTCKRCHGAKFINIYQSGHNSSADETMICPDCKGTGKELSNKTETNMTQMVDNLIDETVDGCKKVISRTIKEHTGDNTNLIKIINKKLNKLKKVFKEI